MELRKEGYDMNRYLVLEDYGNENEDLCSVLSVESIEAAVAHCLNACRLIMSDLAEAGCKSRISISRRMISVINQDDNSEVKFIIQNEFATTKKELGSPQKEQAQ